MKLTSSPGSPLVRRPPPQARTGVEANGRSGLAKISFVTADDVALSGSVVRLGHHQVVFEFYNPDVALRVSEVLPDFAIVEGGKTVFAGRATVRGVVTTGSGATCEALLDGRWHDFVGSSSPGGRTGLVSVLEQSMAQWQMDFTLLPDYKLAVVEIYTWLTQLRGLADHVEAEIRTAHSDNAEATLSETARELGKTVVPVLDSLFERFEDAAARIDGFRQGVHVGFSSRLLHPLLLCSPFLNRAYHKPLGYAGDYGLVNMIASDPAQGGSLFARILNIWFLAQAPAQAHRNRLDYLCGWIEDTVLSAARSKRPARILSIGCGPAIEVQRFMSCSRLRTAVEFSLLDFNQETLDHALSRLGSIHTDTSRACRVRAVRKSVAQLLKEPREKLASQLGGHDLVYCAGLFDYLPDSMCRAMLEAMFRCVSPEGTLIATNVNANNPRRLTMDYIMNWVLIYRDARRLAACVPEGSQMDSGLRCDQTGVNVCLEIQKPKDE